MRYSSSPDNFKLRVMGIRSTLDVAMEDMEKEMGEIERGKKKEEEMPEAEEEQ